MNIPREAMSRGGKTSAARCRCNLTHEARVRGAMASAKVRRAAALAKFSGMTAVEIYRLAYSVGWKRGQEAAYQRVLAHQERHEQP